MKEIFYHARAGEVIESSVFSRLWIVSGGQTGVDRAAMEFALKHRLPLRGWCPKGRLAEDGIIPAGIPVQESSDEDPALRTELNTYDSDATLVLTFSSVKDGTVLTEECARNFGRPLLVFMIDHDPTAEAVEEFRAWIRDHTVRVLNVAGPRESFKPGLVYHRAWSWMERLFLKDG